MLSRGLLGLNCLLWVAGTVVGVRATPLPADLAEVLAHFRAEGPKGWSFTQTTESGGESLVEYFDAAQPEPNRWKLLRKNGRPPTADELATYDQGKAMHVEGFTAPRIQDQFDVGTAVLVRENAGHSAWRFQFKPGGDDDKTSRFMTVTVSFDHPTHTIERIEIESTGPFSPVFGVKIYEVRTVMNYTLPSAESPSQLERATVHVRGRAFWFKNLDQDMTVTFSDRVRAGKK